MELWVDSAKHHGDPVPEEDLAREEINRLAPLLNITKLARLGSRSDGTPSFWLQIERAGGKVFSTGRWSTSETEIRRLAERLSAEIGCECRGGIPLSPASAGRVAAAAIGAVVLYAAWFRFSAGPWCPAMWFGTAPPVIVLATFALLLGLFRRFWV